MKMKKLIEKGWEIKEIADHVSLQQEYDNWCCEIKKYLKQEGFSEEIQQEMQIKMWYVTNEFSKEETRKSIMRAIKAVIECLEENDRAQDRKKVTDREIVLLEQILNNFYLYYRSMFQNPLHKKAALSMNDLKKIRIENEYDLQRMLYVLLVPVFPMIRQEVESNDGYSGMRADLYLQEQDVIIETKCTRGSMNEKKLTEELGADGFHYQANIIFFFVYDKNNIIKNPDAFKAAFAREQEKNGKTIKVILLQPMEL